MKYRKEGAEIISGLAEYVLGLYIKWFEKREKSFYPKQLEEEFAGLHPGKNVKKQIMDYYRKKAENAIKIGLIGILVVVLFAGKLLASNHLKDGKFLERSPMEGEDKEILLEAEIGEAYKEEVVITIGKRELSEMEKRALLAEVTENLEEIIKGQNQSLKHVTHPLNLITEWEESQVSIDWISNNYGVINEDGFLGEDEIPKEGVEVELTAEISLDDMICEKKILITVFPKEKSEEELRRDELMGLINQKERASRSSTYLELPTQFKGKDILWVEKKSEINLWIVMFPVIAVLVVIWGMDKEVHKQYQNRNRQLVLEYSEFVSKLQLLIGAGMSTRNAFSKLAADYKKRRNAGGKKRFVYEEVIMAVRKMETGTSEEEAYEYFAKRCEPGCYRKLVSIILQNQKKGMEGLKESLSVEAGNAFEERKQEATRLGEEAGTKLLLPMMMMMEVVLMIIVIPAYFSFGGI